MTSKVIVDAHAGWPMQVTAIDQTTGEGPGSKETVLGVVAPKEQGTFYVTNTRKLLIEELPRPAETTE